MLNLEELKQALIEAQEVKKDAIQKMNYEKAAEYRDIEKQILKKIEESVHENKEI